MTNVKVLSNAVMSRYEKTQCSFCIKNFALFETSSQLM